MSNETTLVNYLVKNLRAVGNHVQRIENKMSSGVPDINACEEGTELWIEAKVIRKLNKDETFDSGLSPLQINWIRDRVKAGGKVLVVFRVEELGNGFLFCFKPHVTPHVLTAKGVMKMQLADCWKFPSFHGFLDFARYAVSLPEWGGETYSKE